MTPVVKLLRLMDGEKPAMGKVYDRMFMIGQKIAERTYTWKDKAAVIHSTRWEYLHSEMHAAGYALDPEFMETAGALDQATQDGLSSIVERVALRDIISEATEQAEARRKLKIEGPEVQARIAKTMEQLATFQAKEGHLHKAVRAPEREDYGAGHVVGHVR